MGMTDSATDLSMSEILDSIGTKIFTLVSSQKRLFILVSSQKPKI